MTNITIHKAPTGKSIRAQLMKTTANRGVIIYTFWWNNTVTKMEAFTGQTKKWVFANTEQARESFRQIEAQGYTRIEA